MPILAQILISIALAAVSYMLRPTPPGPKAPGLGDIDIPQTEQGRCHGVVFGKKLVQNLTVSWYGDLSTSEIKKSA